VDGYRIIEEVNNKEKKSLHGLILNDRLIEFYKFRKSIVKKYNFGSEYFLENKKQKKQYKKDKIK